MRTPDYFESMEIRFILSQEIAVRQCALTSIQASSILKQNGYGKARFGAAHTSDVLAEIKGITIVPPPYRGGVAVVVVNRLAELNPLCRHSPTADKAYREHQQTSPTTSLFPS